MFGFGKAKAYQEKVSILLRELDCSKQLTIHPSPRAQIEACRIAEGYLEHETALLFSYSHVLYLEKNLGVEEAQKHYNKTLKFEEAWVTSRLVRPELVDAFHEHIANNSPVKVKS